MGIKEYTPAMALTDSAYTNTAGNKVDSWDVLSSSFEQGLRDNVTGSIVSGLEALNKKTSDTDKQMNGKDANDFFGLSGAYAFEDGETVNESYAELRHERQLEIEHHQRIIEVASQESPVLATIANIGGSLGGGIADPVGIIGGAALGSLGTRAAAKMASSATKSLVGMTTKVAGITPTDKLTRGLLNVGKTISSGQAYKGLGGAALGATDTVVGIAALDLPALAINRELYGEHLSKTEALAMFVGAGLLGGGLGAAIGYKGGVGGLLGMDVTDAQINESSRKLGQYINYQYGDKALDAVNQQLAHSDALARMGVLENPNYVTDMFDDMHFSVRGGQEGYNYVPMEGLAKARDTVFYASKADGAKDFTQATGRGFGALELSDARHIKENFVKGLDNTGDGSVATVKLSDNANMFDESPDNLNRLRGILKTGIKELVGDVNTDRAFMVKDVQGALDYLATLDGVTDAPTLFNRILAEAGYDGYITAGTNSKGIAAYNSAVILDKAKLGVDAGHKAVYGADEFNPNVLQKINVERISDVNHDDPMTAGVIDSIKKRKISEIDRAADPTQRIDYVSPSERALTPEEKNMLSKSTMDDVLNAQADKVQAELDAMPDTFSKELKDKLSKDMEFIKDSESFKKLKENFTACSLGKALGGTGE